MTRFYFTCDDADISDYDGADLIHIDAETQAEAEAKLLAEPGLIGVSNIGDFDVSFRAVVSDRYFQPQSDNTVQWLTVIQIILTERKQQGWNLFDYDNTGLLHIEKDDTAHIFESDTAAVEYVRLLAASGDSERATCHPTP